MKTTKRPVCKGFYDNSFLLSSYGGKHELANVYTHQFSRPYRPYKYSANVACHPGGDHWAY